MSDIITFDVAQFRLAFPAFTDPPYSDVTLQIYWTQATCYISDVNYGWLYGECRRLALNLMTAHLAYLSTQIAAGQTTGVVQAAAIDKINITLTAPPITESYYSWWLSESPYGQQLYSLLSAKSVGGLYISGGGALAGFRGPGGYC